MAGSALLAYTDQVSNNQDVYYVGTDQHMHLLWWNGDPWKTLDLTAITGAPSAQPGFQFVRTNNSNSFYFLTLAPTSIFICCGGRSTRGGRLTSLR